MLLIFILFSVGCPSRWVCSVVIPEYKSHQPTLNASYGSLFDKYALFISAFNILPCFLSPTLDIHLENVGDIYWTFCKWLIALHCRENVCGSRTTL